MKQVNKDFFQQEEDYTNIIVTSPQSLYENIDIAMVKKWKECLVIKDLPLYSAQLPLVFDQTQPISKVIIFDCERSRVRESQDYPTFKQNLQNLIQSFCQLHKCEYKQGINEIIAPFLLLTYQLDLSLDDAYVLFDSFISKYAMTYYDTRDILFSKLKNSLYLFSLLLKYHEPSIAALFQKEGIQPEMYSMCWFMTVFSNKLQIDMVYHLWNVIILNDDPLFIHFLLLSLILHHKPLISQLEKTELLCLLSRLSFKSIKDCNEIIQGAFALQQRTPFSFKMLYTRPDLFQTRENNVNSRTIDPEAIDIMPVFPYEFIHLFLRDEFIDYHYTSKANIAKGDVANENKNEVTMQIAFNDDEKSEEAKLTSGKALPYLIFDFRGNDCDIPMGAKAISISGNLIEGDNRDKLLETLRKDRGNYHIILLASETAYFKRIKKGKKYSAEKVSQYIQFQIVKELLLDNDFPYVSYIYCGFKAVHQLITSSRISFSNHSEDKCSLCHKSRVQLDMLRQIISDSKTNGLSIKDYTALASMPLTEIISTCTLRHFNSQSYVNTPLLIVLNDNIIALYSKAQTKKADALFDFTFSYSFENGNGFQASYNPHYDNHVTLYFSLNELKGIYEDTLMIDFLNKKDSMDFYEKILARNRQYAFDLNDFTDKNESELVI